MQHKCSPTLVETIADHVRSWKAKGYIHEALLLGSVARGEPFAQDIDLLVMFARSPYSVQHIMFKELYRATGMPIDFINASKYGEKAPMDLLRRIEETVPVLPRAQAVLAAPSLPAPQPIELDDSLTIRKITEFFSA